jgi:uncharacterized protein (TIGR00369 family)
MISQEISDKDYEIKVKDSFSRQNFMNTLGAKITKLGPGFCEISMPFQDSLTQQHHFIHAGAIGAIADSAAGYSAFTLSPPHSSVLTVEYKLNLLTPAKGEEFVARSRILPSGKKLKVAFCEVYAIENKQETLCAILTATVKIIQNKADLPL